MTVAELAALLTENGRPTEGAELESLMQGIVAGPPALDDRWMDLIGDELNPEVRQQLQGFRSSFEHGTSTGLGIAPAPADRLEKTRAMMRASGVTALIVPRTDEYQGEYVSMRAERLQWLSGFAGSAGAAALKLDSAAIFVDGRYTLQVRDQVNTDVFTVRHISEEPLTAWIEEMCDASDKIGVDPWLHTKNSIKAIQTAVKKAGAEMVLLLENPIDQAWDDQPSAPLAAVRPHEIIYSGEESAEKRTRLADGLKAKGAKAAVLTASDSIAWLLNVRGGDVPRCPLPLSFAVLHDDAQVDWFIDPRKLVTGVAEHLGNGVTVSPIEGFSGKLEELGKAGSSVMADPASCPLHVFSVLENAGASVVEGADPCTLPKAMKNTVELAGTRDAHRRDGAAVTRFLAWLPEAVAKGGVTELSASDALQAFRFRDDKIRDLSFDTISGAGPDGAIVHYRVTSETDRPLSEGELYLVDSGGQYLDGTTDITRTIALGKPSLEMRDRFTRVLKGHIAIATARFPKGVNGSQLDPLARQHLWRVGLDYDHGTGHGVGSYLNVHEGPQRIAKMPSAVPLAPGMILSNEPGFYKTGAYGIRIENLIVVEEFPELAEGEKPLYGFETITFAPIDRNLIERGLLNDEEADWLNAYHAMVRDLVMPQLTDRDDGPVRAFLEEATKPI